MGLDVAAEFPLHPTVEIINDGHLTIAECVEKILAAAAAENLPGIVSFDRDTAYWNDYYVNHPAVDGKPSLFAEFALERFKPGDEILELGCGNGRDSIFFLRKGFSVIGVDASNQAIADIGNIADSMAGLFVCGDFVKNKVLYQKRYDVIYSRFTWHSITATQETELLQNVSKALKNNGKLLIEARSVNDDLCGKGTAVGGNAFIHDGHYRRFIDMADLKSKIEDCGLVVTYAMESRNFAPTEKENPMIIRVVAEKK